MLIVKNFDTDFTVLTYIFIYGATKCGCAHNKFSEVFCEQL